MVSAVIGRGRADTCKDTEECGFGSQWRRLPSRLLAGTASIAYAQGSMTQDPGKMSPGNLTTNGLGPNAGTPATAAAARQCSTAHPAVPLGPGRVSRRDMARAPLVSAVGATRGPPR